jgi:hypothetical protein
MLNTKATQDHKAGARHQDLRYNNTYRVQDCEWATHQAQGAIVCDG